MQQKTNENINSKLQLLKENFIEGLLHAQKDLSIDEKNAIGFIIVTMFNRWASSTLLSGTAISPSNIINNNADCPDNGVNKLKLKYNHTNHLILESPVLDDYTLELVSNDLKNHSFIKDLNTVLNYFTPANIMTDFSVCQTVIPKSIKENDIDDPFYYNYLVLIIKKLNLIDEMPSINSQVYKINRYAFKSFDSKQTHEKINIITDAAFEIFEENMSEGLMIDDIITKNDIIECMKNGNVCDDIFEIIYRNLGFDFNHMISLADNDSLEIEDEALLSSVYFVGTLLDKWFFTPFGTYLNLITTVYVEPFDLKSEIDFLRPILLTGCDMTAELFSPCNYYHLTPLGEKIFGFSNFDEEISLRNTSFSKDQLFAVLVTQKSQKHLKSSEKTYNTILELRVNVFADDNLWKTIEIPDTFKLRRLHTTILYFFGFGTTDNNENYKFQLKSKIAEKSPIRRFNRLSEFALKDLNLSDNNLILTSGDETFEISLIRKERGRFTGEYPKLLKQSRDITMLERNDNF